MPSTIVVNQPVVASKVQRWRVHGNEYVYVPNEPAHRELLAELRATREPMATYFAKTGHVIAWQWSLPNEE